MGNLYIQKWKTCTKKLAVCIIYSYVVLCPLLRPRRPRLRGFECDDLRVSMHSSRAFLVVSVILARSIRLLGGGAFLIDVSGDLDLCIY